jgi:hypothetical protein
LKYQKLIGVKNVITENLENEVLKTFRINMEQRLKRKPTDIEIALFLDRNVHKIEHVNAQLKQAIQKLVNEHIDRMCKNENLSN